MNYKDFKFFTSIEDNDNVLTVEYQTKHNGVMTETYKHEDLKKCPFCGGNAIISPTSCFEKPAVWVKCSHCHVSTTLVTVGYHFSIKEMISWTDALNKATRFWNMRSQEVRTV